MDSSCSSSEKGQLTSALQASMVVCVCMDLYSSCRDVSMIWLFISANARSCLSIFFALADLPGRKVATSDGRPLSSFSQDLRLRGMAEAETASFFLGLPSGWCSSSLLLLLLIEHVAAGRRKRKWKKGLNRRLLE